MTMLPALKEGDTGLYTETGRRWVAIKFKNIGPEFWRRHKNAWWLTDYPHDGGPPKPDRGSCYRDSDSTYGDTLVAIPIEFATKEPVFNEWGEVSP